MDKVIGVVGLGIMGGAFARNLVAAGWRVIGCDVEPARSGWDASDPLHNRLGRCLQST